MTKLEKANNYIKENINKIHSRPDYHFTPEIGWLNDPNGFSYYNKNYHLFYQFYPYDIKWNDMHWGHAISKDLITWEYEKVAMSNDTISDANGCFSGSAIEKDGKLYLLYTGLINPNMGFRDNPNEIIQHQCLAHSEDGINFTKYEKNPVISQYDLPEGYKRADFRDPKVIEKDGIYYVVMVAKNKEGRGDILLYKSNDLVKWNFLSAVYKSKHEENMMLECPDIFSLDGKEVIIFSGMPCDESFEGKVGNTTEYLVGSLDFEKGVFQIESRGIVDYGHSFYAPQSMEDMLGNRITIGWMKKWVNKTIQVPEEFGWNGMMSLPRVLSLKDGTLIQKPVESISNYFVNKIVYKNTKVHKETFIHEVEGHRLYLKLDVVAQEADMFTLNLFGKEDKAVKLNFDLAKNSVTYNSLYDNMTEKYDLGGYVINRDKINLELFLDKYTIELFLNHGEKVFSFTNFTKYKGDKISFESNKGAEIVYLEKQDIIKR